MVSLENSIKLLKKKVTSLHGKQKGKKQKQWQILFSWAPKSLSILKEINPDYSLKTNAEAEAPLLWPPDMTS